MLFTLSTTLLLALVCSNTLAQEIGSPEVLSADMPALQIQSVEHDGGDRLLVKTNAALGNDVSIFNFFYGVDEDSLVKCTSLKIEEDRISCESLARGSGFRMLVLERVDANGDVEARHRFRWSFRAPVVESLSGGRDGVPLEIGGANFGPADAGDEPLTATRSVEVYVGPFAAHSAEAPCRVVGDDGKRIECVGGLPIGFGTGLRVRVCVDGVCGESERALHDYAAPVVHAAHLVGGRLHLYGEGFGPLRAAGDAPLELEIDGKPCPNAEVVVADREVACDATSHEPQHSHVLARRNARTGELVARSTLHVRQVNPTVTGVEPNSNVPTDGRVELVVTGTDFGPAGSDITVNVGGRAASNCRVTTDNTAITCARAPAGAGANLAVRVTTRLDTTFELANALSYAAPSISYMSNTETSGGKTFVHGANFGPSFVAVTVTLYAGTPQAVPCRVIKHTHDKIQCRAPHGTGENHLASVSVAGQTSRAVRAFSYKRPDIHATTRPHWSGGHMYIRGHNFGRDDDEVTVYIEDHDDHWDECKYVKITKSHKEIRCRAPAGAADGTLHRIKVRVDGQSSSKSGHSFKRMQYGNNVPTFAPHSDHYTAVACDPLAIELPASDADGDEFFYRGRGLPEGASWKNAFGYMQIEYSVPLHRLEYPHTEMNVTIEAAVTDGPGSASTLLHVTARACPASMDTCKDLSCARRDAMCPHCPTSGVVRCSAARPILDVASGSCHALPADADDEAMALDPIADAGYTVDVTAHGVYPLHNKQQQRAGVLVTMPKRLAPNGPQPCGQSLTCVDVSSCDARATEHAPKGLFNSHAVHVASASKLDGGAYLGLPTFSAGIGSVAADGYGYCLGKYSVEHNAWHCVDESLTLRSNMLAGELHGAGCYALIRDNCPDHHNPMQYDRDANGEGDLCQGGATLCEDCHSWDSSNVKYLKKHAPEQQETVHDDCAKNQSPCVITTEKEDRYNVQD